MKKISIIGAGGIGGELASLIALNSLGNIRLIDIDEGIAKGKALDLIQSFSVKNKCVAIKGSSNLSEIQDSDVIIVTAGISRKPGMTRDDLIGTNTKIIEKIGLAIKEFSENAFVICITNPLDAMVWVLKQTSGLKKHMVVGMAGILDSLRFKYFLSRELNICFNSINAMVLGGHGDTMVPLLNYVSINGIPIREFIKNGLINQERLEFVIKKTRNGGGEIVSLLKTGSAFYSPAVSALEMMESFLFDQKKLLACSAYLEGEYNVKNYCVGVPVVIGLKGIEKIIELEFEPNEKTEFDKSANAVKEITEKCKKLLV